MSQTKMGMPRLVVCAAAKNVENGQIVCSPRHHDSIMRESIKTTKTLYSVWEQGFVDQRGEFLTREEAHSIALAEDQIRRRCGDDERTLFSENLY